MNQFLITTDGEFLLSLKHEADEYGLNWVQGHKPWGTVIKPRNLSHTVSRGFTDRCTFFERYTFTNETEFPIFTDATEVGIYTTFNDDYYDAKTSLTERCHAHIWTGGEVSYVCAVRMGGEPPHLGLVLTEGALCKYSTVRDLSEKSNDEWDITFASNDRGDFILHPKPIQLDPGESFVVCWELFWHDGMEDFYRKLREFPNYIDVKASKYILLGGESADITIFNNGEDRTFTATSDKYGEFTLPIEHNGIATHITLLALPNFDELFATRVRFIAEKQQYHKSGSPLDGAYLAYDNEEGRMVYRHVWADESGGRERVAMGAIMARYLQRHSDETLRKSLDKYLEYIERELFDEQTGQVFNDIRHDDAWDRLYNYPWLSQVFIEVYRLTNNRKYLAHVVRIMESYYSRNGSEFCSIGMPIESSIKLTEAAGLITEKERLMDLYRKHADLLLARGTDYPAQEVNYEQSIVAPAVSTLLQFYMVSKEPKYLQEAERQLIVLGLFNGLQPHYRLNEVSIRHWDGYWFGKRKMYGDTFPHYWSSLTGIAFFEHWRATGDENSKKRAEVSLRGSLSMFNPDGSATCAFIFPETLNGLRGNFSDPYANDQDWALFYAAELFWNNQ